MKKTETSEVRQRGHWSKHDARVCPADMIRLLRAQVPLEEIATINGICRQTAMNIIVARIGVPEYDRLLANMRAPRVMDPPRRKLPDDDE